MLSRHPRERRYYRWRANPRRVSQFLGKPLSRLFDFAPSCLIVVRALLILSMRHFSFLLGDSLIGSV